MEDLISIGYTKKAHGIKGAIRVSIKDQYLATFEEIDVLFLAINGRNIPYFIESKIFETPYRIKLEDHPTREAIEPLTSKEILVQKDKIIAEAIPNDLIYGAYLDYLIVDQVAGEIGTILDIQEFPQQEMAIVQYQGKEILLPLNTHLIESIEEDSKTIVVNLPEGLLNL